MRMIRFLSIAGLCAAALAATPAPAAGQGQGRPASIGWTLKKAGDSLEYEALLAVLDRDGRPVFGAVIDVSFDMPSMPGAHRSPPVRATPTPKAGQYVARFQLEMAGEWMARIEMTAPHRVKLFQKFHAH